MNDELTTKLREMVERQVPCDAMRHARGPADAIVGGKCGFCGGTSRKPNLMPDPKFAALRTMLSLLEDFGARPGAHFWSQAIAGALDEVAFAHGYEVRKSAGGTVALFTFEGLDNWVGEHHTSIENQIAATYEAVMA